MNEQYRPQTALDKLDQAIAAQETLRGILDDAEIETALSALYEKQAALLGPGGIAPGPDVQATLTGPGAIAQTRGTAAGAGGVAVAGHVFGSIYHIYRRPPGRSALSEDQVRHVLGEYLRWARDAYRKARLYGLESLPTAQGRPVRQLKDVFVPITLCRFQPPRQAELEELAEGSAGHRDDRIALARAWARWTERPRDTTDDSPRLKPGGSNDPTSFLKLSHHRS